MRSLTLILALAAPLSGAGCGDLADVCPGYLQKRDANDIHVFLRLSGATVDQFCSSSSLRSQYDRWAAGEVAIDGNATRARQAAESAESMSAFSMGLSIGAAGSR